MSYSGARCFWIEPAGLARLNLRRFTFADRIECPSTGKGHDATRYFGTGRSRIVNGTHEVRWPAKPAHDSLLWPTTCDHCHAYEFHPSDEWEYGEMTLYRTLTGSWMGPLLTAAPGAMFDAFWCPWKGEDGLSIAVMLPNHQLWSIDHRAIDCTMPNERNHHCWVRHGKPPRLTVDKVGYTCQAGAGTVQSGDYRGALVNGELSAG